MPRPKTRMVPRDRVLARLRAENPWWAPPHEVEPFYAALDRRAYFRRFFHLVSKPEVRRATVLMGPRRVGKTVLLKQAVAELLRRGTDPRQVCYVSVDHPMYHGLGLEDLLEHCREAAESDRRRITHVFFDEIQYLRDWEAHLKSLFDSHPEMRIVASGSAAAALRLKSHESGAGRFTDFLLPPLTFHEFIELTGASDLVKAGSDDMGVPTYECDDIEALNRCFIDYVNYGGYPEVALSEELRSDPARYVRSDIIDKVLLRDLPGLYGIKDIQELNALFTTLAYNTANEVSLEALSQKSGVAKNTIKRYIEYLEASFLLRRVHRVDKNARRFKRAWSFKVYLTNASMWSALFSPIDAEGEAMGPLAETAVFAQWFHDPSALHYARWSNGEVDLVGLGGDQRPSWAVEVKWTDRPERNPERELKGLVDFCLANNVRAALITTRSVERRVIVRNVDMWFRPASLYCYAVGRNLVQAKFGTVGGE